MKKERFTGSTVEEALKKAIEKFDLREGEYEYDVIEKGFPGIFGLFTKEAVVEVKLKRKYYERRLKEFLLGILKHLNGHVRVEVRSSGKNYFVDIDGDRIGKLIGKHGKTLGALQHVSMIFLNRISDTKINVIVDAGEYRERRKRQLETITKEAIEKAIKERGKVILDPMFAFERRIVHEIVKKYRNVISYSIGMEPYRRVVIEFARNRREARMK
ncbi:MAG: protein jag [Thermotogae bacterium]|nr:protein jag [Thermotogaceae bacterium]RKX41348.1 MAG: protein jag [Thermotogota bacterium]RKX50566.1 MAG: protein jag [Thermotogota bacterium]RKX52298.1 MAG: protein jag [Thermotoga sp.]RKX55391.1 MAG: protein jag [Thermotoga sp.]